MSPRAEGATATAAPGATDGEVLLEVRDLVKHFTVGGGLFGGRAGTVRAVEGVSFTLRRGETLGLVGESGCGKTTTGRCILQLERPTSGQVIFEGRDLGTMSDTDLRSMRRRMQVIFQDPYASLNPRMTVGQILAEPLAVHGVVPDRQRRRERVRDLLSRVALLPQHADRYPHQRSGGQRQRVGIARALAVEPSLIVCDEPVSALDVSIQAQIINLLEQLQEEFDLTYLFIAHDLAVVRHISDRIVVMYLGWIVEVSPAAELYEKPLHPYTISLLSAVPIPDPVVERRRESILLSGDLPSPANPPPACRFHTRCPFIQPTRCRDEIPPLRPLSTGHEVACHWAEEILAGQIRPREREPVIVPPRPEPVEELPPV
jgi:oligopeptide/dipeptide ABC transporter ATP-binding protein